MDVRYRKMSGNHSSGTLEGDAKRGWKLEAKLLRCFGGAVTHSNKEHGIRALLLPGNPLCLFFCPFSSLLKHICLSTCLPVYLLMYDSNFISDRTWS